MNNISLSEYNRNNLPPVKTQLKVMNVALQTQRDTTIGLLQKTKQLLDVYV